MRIIEEEKEYWESVINTQVKVKSDFNFIEDINKNIESVTGIMDKDKTQELLFTANRSYNIKTKELLIYALGRTIKEYNNQDEVLINIESHGRDEIFPEIDISRTVGWFTSIFPIRFNLKGDDINNQIKLVKEYLRNIPNGGLGFGIMKYMNNILDFDET